MKILMLPSYFFPEQVSSSHLTNDLLNALSSEGFTIELYTATPCRGIDKETREKYKNIKYEEQYNKSVFINRFSMYSEGKNPVLRAIRYLLCNIIQSKKGCSALDIDLIYSASTPPTQGIMCGFVKKILTIKSGKKIPFIYNLQDVFPDSLVSSGLAKKGSLLWRIGRIIENKTYKNADKIIVISSDIKNNIINKGVPESKITIIPNWINTKIVHHIERCDNKLFDELKIDRNKFCVVYAGNLGMAQGIDSFIDAARDIEDVEFLIFGEGSCKDRYIKKCEHFKNIHLFPFMPSERVSEVYSMGDLCLVSCKKGLGNGAVPSKTFSILATATPVLLSFDSGTELWNLISNNNCGFCTNAGNVEELKNAIIYAKDHQDELREKGENGRICVESFYSKEYGTSRMIETIKDTIKEQRK